MAEFDIKALLEPPKPKWGKPGRPKAEPKAANIPMKRGAQRKKVK